MTIKVKVALQKLGRLLGKFTSGCWIQVSFRFWCCFCSLVLFLKQSSGGAPVTWQRRARCEVQNALISWREKAEQDGATVAAVFRTLQR